MWLLIAAVSGVRITHIEHAVLNLNPSLPQHEPCAWLMLRFRVSTALQSGAHMARHFCHPDIPALLIALMLATNLGKSFCHMKQMAVCLQKWSVICFSHSSFCQDLSLASRLSTGQESSKTVAVSSLRRICIFFH